MHKMNGAEVTIRLLERYGIDTIAGIPGGSNLPLYDALSQSGTIRHILARHEQGAGFMAQGMARATGRPAVCFATSGPGATNILTAIADAKLDSIPVICITGQVPQAMIGTDAFQEVDTYGMSIPITKHNFLVRSAKELLTVIPAAFRIATEGRPGPVLIDIPKDVQLESVEFENRPEILPKSILKNYTDEDLRQAAMMINAAERPVLYLGGGIMHSEASSAAINLAEKNALPTTMTLLGLGAMPIDHPLALTMLGMHAARYTNLVMEECDLLVVAGARFDDRATGKIAEFCPGAKVIHIDIDPGEVDKLRTAQVKLVGDVGAILEELLPLVETMKRDKWRARVATLKSEYPFVMPDADNPLMPYGLIRRIAEIVDDDAIIATDVGKHQMWVAQAYPFRRPRQLLTSGGLGTMGFGLPAAIGASLAWPARTVICFSGDGSILMNIQELATAVEQQVNLKVVVLNNTSLGLVRQQQDLFFGKRYFASEYRNHVDFVTIARGFGMQAIDLGESVDPVADLTAAIRREGPCLIHVPIARTEEVYPMVPPGAANIEMIGGEKNADC
ncbi:MAG: acetolactate synthase large subunit [Proteobacteria bacterium]|nr:acetolactate synthase large subunit [Pseudomonadota bacterium]MBU1715646.1 acetolactate synthase large subunit [Pseudomonadota bacterium]